MQADEQDERVIAYLLGELPEAESALLEERYLADEEAFRHMRAIEAELLDAYSRGSLAVDRSKRVVQRLLNSPRKLEQLEFSRAMVQVRPAVPSRSRYAPFGLAAAILVGAAIWWSASSAPGSRTPQSPPQAVVAFALGPGVVRDLGAEPTVDIPSNAGLLQLTAPLDSDMYPSYSVVLRTPEGEEVWKKTDLHSRQSALVLEIPAALLVNGHYALAISGVKTGGKPDEIAGYSIRVRRL
jgi:hypothetical protein